MDAPRPLEAISDEATSEYAMLLATRDVRRQLKIIAAVTRETMKEVLVRLIAAELKRVAPAVKL